MTVADRRVVMDHQRPVDRSTNVEFDAVNAEIARRAKRIERILSLGCGERRGGQRRPSCLESST